MLSRFTMIRKLMLTLVPACLVVLLGVTLYVRGYVSDMATQATVDSTRQIIAGEGERLVAPLINDLEGTNALASSMKARTLIPAADRRGYADQVLIAYLKDKPGLLAVWTLWEPDSFDGLDHRYRNTKGHDASGRYIPYWYRDADGRIGLDPLVDYNEPGAGDYYLMAKQRQKPVILDPYLYPVGDEEKLITSLVVPIMENGGFVGVVGVDLTVDWISTMAESIQVNGSSLTLLDDSGTLMAHPDKELLGQRIQDTGLGKQLYDDNLDAVLANIKQGKSYRALAQGDQYLALQEPVPLGDTGAVWSAGAVISMDVISAGANEIATSVLLVGGAGVLLLAGAVLLLGRALARPLQNVVQALEGIAEGEGDLTQRLTVKGQDEVAQVSRAFNTFVGRIQEMVSQLARHSQSLTSASTDLEQNNSGSLHRIERQRFETDQVATAVEEMTTTVNELAGNASEASNATGKCALEVSNGQSLVNDVVATIRLQATEVGEAAGKVDELERGSQAIGQVISVIQGIAEQTNLLALNAAIEAARAGEQGRGFAVVADEVRTLAGRTQQATEEIGQTIQHLQTLTEEVVKAMESNMDQSNISVEKAEQTSRALDRIAEQTQALEAMNLQVASATEEQSATMREVAENIMGIRHITEETAESIDEAVRGSESLRRLAREMEGQVGRFRY